MKRKCFLVAEPSSPEGISTRKLLLETAYYNVVTCYSPEELLDTAPLFPNVDAAVVHAELLRKDPRVLVKLRGVFGTKPIVLLTSSGHDASAVADVTLPSHDPQLLMGKLREMFGLESTPPR